MRKDLGDLGGGQRQKRTQKQLSSFKVIAKD
jgi:hypothetical protein